MQHCEPPVNSTLTSVYSTSPFADTGLHGGAGPVFPPGLAVMFLDLFPLFTDGLCCNKTRGCLRGSTAWRFGARGLPARPLPVCVASDESPHPSVPCYSICKSELRAAETAPTSSHLPCSFNKRIRVSVLSTVPGSVSVQSVAMMIITVRGRRSGHSCQPQPTDQGRLKGSCTQAPKGVG